MPNDNNVCDELLEACKSVLGEIWFKSWKLGDRRCAVHIDNPATESAMPKEASLETRTYMSKISIGYPESYGMIEKIGVEFPTARSKTMKRKEQLTDIGCHITAIHGWEVDHIHALCPKTSVKKLVQLIDKTRFGANGND